MKAEKVKKRHKLKLKLGKRYIVNQEKNKLRLCVFRSNKEIYAQIVDDSKGIVVCSESSLKLDEKAKKLNKIEQAKMVGKSLVEKAKEKKVKDIFFDRNGFLYHGRVAALAEGAREGGLKF